MFIVVYQFAVKAGREAAFIKAWQKTTEGIAQFKGGLGSRLHREQHGGFMAYAQWPDQQTYRRASDIVMPAEFEDSRHDMQRCLDIDGIQVLHEMEVEVDCLQSASHLPQTDKQI